MTEAHKPLQYPIKSLNLKMAFITHGEIRIIIKIIPEIIKGANNIFI